MITLSFLDDTHCIAVSVGVLIRPFRRDGVIYIRKGDDSGRQGYVTALDPLRVTASIPLFMMAVCNFPAQGQKGRHADPALNIADCVAAVNGMFFDDLEFLGGQ